MEKFSEELNKEFEKVNTVEELLNVYHKIKKEIDVSLENTLRRITFVNYDDGK